MAGILLPAARVANPRLAADAFQVVEAFMPPQFERLSDGTHDHRNIAINAQGKITAIKLVEDEFALHTFQEIDLAVYMTVAMDVDQVISEDFAKRNRIARLESGAALLFEAQDLCAVICFRHV